LETAPEEQRAYLRFVVDKAKADMRALNAQLSELESKIGKGSSS